MMSCMYAMHIHCVSVDADEYSLLKCETCCHVIKSGKMAESSMMNFPEGNRSIFSIF